MKQRFAREPASPKEKLRRTAGLLLWLLAAGALLFAVLQINKLTPNRKQGLPIVINEIVASNVNYPNSDGRCTDYIELWNQGDIPLDLSGYQLGDIAGAQLYVFPAGTMIQPGEYLVVYCSNTAPEGYAPFEINRGGGESFYLIAENGAIVDSVTTMATDVDQAMLRQADGTWIVSPLLSPGKVNDAAQAPGLDTYNPGVSTVRLSEVSAVSSLYLREHRVLCDWIELYNTSESPADLSGFTLTDNVGNNKFTFPAGTLLDGNSYLLIPCSDKLSDPAVAPFGLSQQYEEVITLLDPTGRIAEMLHTVPMTQGSMILGADGIWTTTDLVSPGYENTAAGHEAHLQDLGAQPGSIRITEVMAADQLILPDSFGEFSDWLELTNATSQPIEMTGWFLSDNPQDPEKWTLPDLTLQAGQRLLIFCTGRSESPADEIHADFSLSSGGETLTLSTFAGTVVDSVTFPASEPHIAFTFTEDGEAVVTDRPTPGYENTDEGYEAFCDASAPAGPLAIWEVMTGNKSYIPQALGQCYDWVELKNISEEPLDLTGWSIADDPAAAGVYPLPSITLQPGDVTVIILTTEPEVTRKGFHQVLFGLDAMEDQLFLFNAEGNLADYVHLKGIPADTSYGRSDERGGFFHMEPSPQNPNTAGFRLISANPTSSYVPGVYSQEDPFTVTLESPGTIHYTTDGSIPTVESAVYEGPLQIEENTVIRAIALEEDKFVSNIYTATFIVGDEHDLPVVSLVTDPDFLFGPGGVYRFGDMSVKEIQMPANVAYSGEDGVFSKDCAMNLHGMTTVTAFSKKTFAVRFQDCYGGPLHYDVFEDGEVTTFSSLLIRTSHEDVVSSQMHDVLISHIASQCSDSVISQKFKFVALYLNGKYWGLYAIRERHSEEHFASYMNHPAEGVSIVRTMLQEDNTLKELFQLCKNSNLISEENYAFAESVMDMDSYIDWLIFESYMANIDIYENLRFYYSEADGLWRMGLADLDLGIMGTHGAFEMQAEAFHHRVLISDLLQNETFQERLGYRLAELLEGPLSDENMIATINEIAATIRSESVWEAERWGNRPSDWENAVNRMIKFCDGRAQEMIDSYCLVTACSAEDRERYFGHLEQ